MKVFPLMLMCTLVVAGSNSFACDQLMKKTLLYVGVQAGVNKGVVTTNPAHLNGTTKKIGYTVDDSCALPEADYSEVLVGTTEGRNEGVVSPDVNHAGGSTSSIGYLSKKPIAGGEKLYVGSASCNKGVVTDNAMHLGCATTFIGYAMPL
ncbi:hypothetical protein [Pseudomonas parasichuanensis]|uniref:hypothetical protein n=1 Tax=Pseudomonas parasichuanensis TaxID=2892329 RepID=UPI001F189759|nr:hypothetical protein [Pseudomonas parasichuanensis]